LKLQPWRPLELYCWLWSIEAAAMGLQLQGLLYSNGLLRAAFEMKLHMQVL